MLNMKLYTEEQVKKMIEKSRETGLTAEFLILTTPAIELPSSTDLQKKAFELHKNSLLEFNSYLDGGKFVIDKIAHTQNELERHNNRETATDKPS